jgi:hypothetical protein
MMREWLDVMIDDRVGRVVFESSVASIMYGKTTNIDTIKLLLGMIAHVEEMCVARVEVREARTADVRNFFIGSNPKRAIAKPLVVKRCHELGWNVENDDQGDACALWAYQVSFLRPDLASSFTPLFQKRR